MRGSYHIVIGSDGKINVISELETLVNLEPLDCHEAASSIAPRLISMSSQFIAGIPYLRQGGKVASLRTIAHLAVRNSLRLNLALCGAHDAGLRGRQFQITGKLRPPGASLFHYVS